MGLWSAYPDESMMEGELLHEDDVGWEGEGGAEVWEGEQLHEDDVGWYGFMWGLCGGVPNCLSRRCYERGWFSIMFISPTSLHLACIY